MVKKDIVQKRMMFNKSYTYVLPMLGAKMDIVKAQLVNTFIGSEEFSGYDNHIFLLYKYIGNPRFIEYEDYLEHSPLFVAKYDPDKYHVCLFLTFQKSTRTAMIYLRKVSILDFLNTTKSKY